MLLLNIACWGVRVYLLDFETIILKLDKTMKLNSLDNNSSGSLKCSIAAPNEY